MLVKTIYSVSDTRTNISEIFRNVSKGFISETLNKATNEKIVMLNNKMLNGLLKAINVENICEYDEELKIYTFYSVLIPQLYGEGATKEEAIENMVNEAMEFVKDYENNVDMYSSIFDGVQQFILGNLFLHKNDREKIKEILKIG
jgi:intergrase/recombinase